MTAARHDAIKACLIDLVGGMNRTDTRQMLAHMEQLDRFVTAERATLDPRLAHFLERRSYAKALEFLEGNAHVPGGTCAPPSQG